MPLYMDVHRNMKGLTRQAVSDAHEKDLKVQNKHGVKFVNYWYSENEGAIFCLCEAPSKDAATAMHREAHGGVPDEVIEVAAGES